MRNIQFLFLSRIITLFKTDTAVRTSQRSAHWNWTLPQWKESCRKERFSKLQHPVRTRVEEEILTTEGAKGSGQGFWKRMTHRGKNSARRNVFSPEWRKGGRCSLKIPHQRKRGSYKNYQWTCRIGEVDIVAQDSLLTLCFVEIRHLNKDLTSIMPELAVNKQAGKI